MTEFVTRRVDPHEVLAAAIAEAGSTNSFARQHGLSGAYVSNVTRRRKGFGDRLLTALQIERMELFFQLVQRPDGTFINTVLGEPWPGLEGDPVVAGEGGE